MPFARLLVVAPLRTVSFVAAIVALLLSPMKAFADGNQFYGSMEEDIPIIVSPYHGLEPKISLHYSSSAGNGPVGVGWNITGFSVVERTGPNGGAPTWTNSDIYLLDGQELVPCVSGSVSPSCNTGGTHSTKIESYSKITFDGTNWTVRQKDGTSSQYTSVSQVQIYSGTPQTWKWGINNVQSPSNGYVAYGWAQNAFGTCCWEYPSWISYNGTLVSLNWEQRSDVETHGTGDWSNTNNFASYYGRIKSIDVTVSGVRARAYKLTYTTSGSTTRSLLSKVQQYGKDATLDSTGTVTGGTSTPAIVLTPTTATKTLTDDSAWVSGANANFDSETNGRRYAMDVNGDGKTDMVIGPDSAGKWYVLQSTGTSFANLGAWISGAYGNFDTDGSHRRYPMDVNGDGKMDMVIGPDSAGKWYVLRSTGTSFVNDGAWISGAYANWGSDSYGRRYPMDVNGDGKTDMVLGPDANGKWYVLLSTGKAFVDAGVWATANPNLAGDTHGLRYPMDVNGDGKMDMVTGPDSSGNWYVLRSTGTSFVVSQLAFGMFGNFSTDNDGRRYPMDVNGDGKMDMVLGPDAAGNWSVLLSTGAAFIYAGNWATGKYSQFGSSGDSSHRRYPMDLNGDGKTDLLIGPDAAGKWYVLRSTGSSFVDDGAWITGAYGNWGGDGSGRRYPADVDGNGKADMVLGPDAAGKWYVLRTPTAAADLVSKIDNGMGGSTTITYTPSSAFPSTNNPPIIQTVSGTQTSDGRGSTSSVSYSFQGGLWDAPGRQFLGFRYSKKTLPCIDGETAPACPFEETWFKQDYGSVSKPETIRRNKADNTLLTENTFQYATNGASIPYQSVQTGAWVNVYDGSGHYCTWPTSAGTGTTCAYGSRTYVAQAYDNYDASSGTWSFGYGNVVTEYTYGNYDVAGDEVTAWYDYVPNTSAFITGKQAIIETFSGIGFDGALVSEALFYYDGASNWYTQPTAGKPTSSLKWLDWNNSLIATNATYDAYGSVISETDEVGATTTYELDPNYSQYVTKTTNTLGQSTAAVWDPQCGVKTSMTDVNGQTTTMTFDKMCRLTKTSSPLGAFVQQSYVNVGNPTTSYVEVDTPAADGSGNLWTRNYYDGLGRVYQTVKKGPTSAVTITQSTVYNARGKVSQMSAPYSTGEVARYETTTYDMMDRVLTVTHADGAKVMKSYAMCGGYGCATTVDESGHKERVAFDAVGRQLWRDEWFGTPSIPLIQTRTNYYDARGNLSQVSDGAGNNWWFGYDSLGRKRWSSDPDAGYWSYDYNDGGRLVDQIDAMGNEATFQYDMLGRKTVKTVYTPTTMTQSTWTYDEPASGYFNVGHLTTSSNVSATTKIKYDALGRVVNSGRTIGGVTYTTKAGYDAGSRVLWTTYPDNDTVGTSASPIKYDGSGQLYSIPGVISSVTYDARGNPLTQTNTNGTTTTRGYSATRLWLTSISTAKGSTTLQGMSYTRDSEGKISQFISSFGSEGWTYTYDQHRLATAKNPYAPNLNQTLQYDNLGNLTYNSAVGLYTYPQPGYDRPHAVTQAGSLPYQYDDNGNMISGNGNTLTWDGDGHLVNVSGMAYEYDAEGMRVKKINGSTTTTYVSDDYEVTGGVVTKYISLGSVQVARRVGTTTSWLHTDHNGSIQVETNSSGVEVLRRNYGPLGSVVQSQTSLTESRGYSAQRQDEIGLFYLHARYYDPVIGRFISPDPTVPAGNLVGLNRYEYAGNDSANHTDTNGLSWWGDLAHFVYNTVMIPVHWVTSAWDAYGAGVEAVANSVGGIPIIGSIAVAALALNPCTAIAWATHDFGSWAKPAAISAIMVGAAALTVMTGGLSAPAMIAAQTAIGFVEGASIAAISGASLKQSIGAGIRGALISGAMAVISVAAQTLGADEVQLRKANGEQTENYTGTHMDQLTPEPDAQGSQITENSKFMRTNPVAKYFNDTGYSASHDALARNAGWGSFATKYTNLVYPFVYFPAYWSVQYGADAFLIKDVAAHD